jgi:Creatinine amidohydrolase
MKKHRLAEMSWVEAEEAFRRSDTVIVAVGTLHGHGPTPIGIDAASVERLADEVGRRTRLMTLPPLYYGENDKMREYPGSLAISQGVLEEFYTDIWRSLHRNGTRKIIVLNGHGGNREPLVRSGRNVRELGMLMAILEWWNIGKKLTSDAFPEGTHIWELAVAAAVGGTDLIDLRGDGYKGEWGVEPPLRRLFGEQIRPMGFNSFEYRGAPVIIPVDAWDIDIESPPHLDKRELEALRRRGEESIERLAGYVVEFAGEFQKVDVAKALAKS